MICHSSFLRRFALSTAISLLALQQAAPYCAAADTQNSANVAGSNLMAAAAGQTFALAGQQPQDSVSLKGLISVYDGLAPEQMVGNLVNAALQRDQSHEALVKKNEQMKGNTRKIVGKAQQTLQFMTSYRGFEMSSEAADVILDEKLRLKSDSSTEYAKQKQVDEVHTKIFSSLLQLAQGLGTSDPVLREKAIATGMAPLNELVGKDSADKALAQLKSWSEQVTVPPAVFRHQPWTMMDLQQRTDDLLKESAQADPVMGLVRRALHKFNGHSNFMRGAAKVINTTLSVAQVTPTLASPCASILFFCWEMSTGGTEDYKLLKELYLDKRLECRWKRLNQEATQSVNAYNNAIMTRNPVLLSLSESFITALGGEEASSRIIGSQRLVARKSTHDDAIDCVQTHTAM